MEKQKIIDYLNQQLGHKIEVLRTNTIALTEARNNEDKCTVGDKYETGRAMTQMELEKSQVQLAQTENLRNSLLKINAQRNSETVEFGSLVETNHENYFFSIAFGKVEIEGLTIFCLSPVSPVGKILLGKKVGDQVNFQGKEMKITRIC